VSRELGICETEHMVGVFPADFDLDGKTDLLVIPESNGEIPRVYLRNESASWKKLYDAGGMIQLDPAATSGATIHDWNGDGDPDVYFGRPAPSGALDNKFFYRTKAASGPDQQSNKWVGVHLTGAGGGNNRSAIGASVVLKKSGVAGQRQIVDGGSSRGGQRSRDLIFGLGNYSGPAPVAEVHWPNGYTQNVTLNVNAPNPIEDSTPVSVSNVAFANTTLPGGIVRWTFSWDTPYLTNIASDEVVVTKSLCGQGTTTYHTGLPGVSCTISKAGGGYHHVMIINDLPCPLGCMFSYTVSSSTLFNSATSSPGSFKVKVCVQ